MSEEFGISTVIETIDAFEVWFKLAKVLNEYASQRHGTTDPLLQDLGRLHAELSNLQGQELAAWVTEREENISFLQAHSYVALQTVRSFAQSGAAKNDPYWSNRLALAARDSLLAVRSLINNIDTGYWCRPDSIGAVSWSGNPLDYDTGWMPHLADRPQKNGMNRVWDYRWALPAAIYAINCRIAVLRATSNSRSTMAAEIAEYVAFSVDVYRRMEDGVKSLEHVSEEQRNRYGHRGQIPIAVVDMHGGYFVGGLFWSNFSHQHFDAPPFPAELPELPIPRELIIPSYEYVTQNHRILTNHFRNHVAIKIGLPSVLRFSSKLEELHTKLSLPRPEHRDDRIVSEEINRFHIPPPISG